MKKILLDENLPQPLRHLLGQGVATVAFMGWSGIQNGELIKRADGSFDIFITGDQNLRYQQNLADRELAIIELPFTRLDAILDLLPALQSAIMAATKGSYTQITSQ